MSMDHPIFELSEEEFPRLLREINDPPKRLYVRGALAPLGERALLTIVGSRHYTSYGKEAVQTLVSGLRGYPITIVSGLALGIDRLAHEAALDAGLKTVAVPGSGLDDSVLYPTSHTKLAYRILEAQGTLLSELEPMNAAAPWTFPQRNRIMAGMSHAVLIIEASKKSGTLITARLGMEYNRDVLAVPGSIFSPNSYGPHTLIRDGATPVTESADILEALGFKRENTPVSKDAYAGCSAEEQKVLALLFEPLPQDEVIRLLAIDTSTANILLSLMELKGLIKENNGKISRAMSF